jgi:Luciferase-like monooxygenase
MILTGLGIWTAQFDFHPAKLIFQAVQELEELGYTSLWLGENVGREPISQSALMLDATETLIVASAVANVWARDPLATLAAQRTISDAHPDRFILGLGVSHPILVDSLRRLHYTSPLQMMASYLRSLDELLDRYRAVRTSATVRLLGALGPRMLNLSSVMADGAHTYLVPLSTPPRPGPSSARASSWFPNRRSSWKQTRATLAPLRANTCGVISAYPTTPETSNDSASPTRTSRTTAATALSTPSSPTATRSRSTTASTSTDEPAPTTSASKY